MVVRNAVLSIHGAVVASIAIGLLGWMWTAGISPGRGAGSNADFLVWTGWIVLAVYVFLFLYSVRKNAHRYGYSPEFGREVPLSVLEEAHRRISLIRTRIGEGKLGTRQQIVREAKHALREVGAQRVLRVQVQRSEDREQRFVLETPPREPLFRLAAWFEGHVDHGILAALLVWLHGGLEFGSPMATLLNGLSLLVLGSGFLGLWMWTTGPRRLTAREREISLEKALALRGHYACKLDEVSEAMAGEESLTFFARRLESAAPTGVRALLAEAPPDSRATLEDFAVLANQRARVESEWKDLSRLHARMHAWRVVHVPGSILLMVLVVVHVISVIYY